MATKRIVYDVPGSDAIYLREASGVWIRSAMASDRRDGIIKWYLKHGYEQTWHRDAKQMEGYPVK